jgi:hypothetical protein
LQRAGCRGVMIVWLIFFWRWRGGSDELGVDDSVAGAGVAGV